MKSTKEKTEFYLGDLPSSSKPFGNKFNEAFKIIAYLFEESSSMINESIIKQKIAEKMKITTDSARKYIRDFRYLGLLEKIGKAIFITQYGSDYDDLKEEPSFMKDLMKKIPAPIQEKYIDVPWLELIEFLKTKNISDDIIINLYFLSEEELKKDFKNIEKNINKKGKFKETNIIGYKNRISHLNSLFDIFQENKKSFSDEISKQYITRRRFQGKFRNNLIKESSGLSMVKAIENYKLMIASHIIDFKDSKGTLNEYDNDNGLLLSPNIDKLFDQKIITFDQTGKILVAEKNIKILESFGLNPSDKLEKKYLTIARKKNLEIRNKMYFRTKIILYTK